MNIETQNRTNQYEMQNRNFKWILKYRTEMTLWTHISHLVFALAGLSVKPLQILFHTLCTLCWFQSCHVLCIQPLFCHRNNFPGECMSIRQSSILLSKSSSLAHENHCLTHARSHDEGLPKERINNKSLRKTISDNRDVVLVPHTSQRGYQICAAPFLVQELLY